MIVKIVCISAAVNVGVQRENMTNVSSVRSRVGAAKYARETIPRTIILGHSPSSSEGFDQQYGSGLTRNVHHVQQTHQMDRKTNSATNEQTQITTTLSLFLVVRILLVRASWVRFKIANRSIYLCIGQVVDIPIGHLIRQHKTVASVHRSFAPRSRIVLGQPGEKRRKPAHVQQGSASAGTSIVLNALCAKRGQFGSVPAAAKSFDEKRTGVHTPPENVDGIQFIPE